MLNTFNFLDEIPIRTLFLPNKKNQKTKKYFKQYIHDNYEVLRIPYMSYTNFYKTKYHSIKNP